MTGALEWQRAALVPLFALFYVVLAPFVGAFADRFPKGKVMLVSNAIKVGWLPADAVWHPSADVVRHRWSWCCSVLAGEIRHPDRNCCRHRNWSKPTAGLKGLTIASIILGVVLGGALVGNRVGDWLLDIDVPFIEFDIATAPEAALACLIFVYVIAAVFNMRIPHTGVAMQPMPDCAICCPSSGPATPARGATSWAKSRWQRPRCSGPAPTSSTSCWPGGSRDGLQHQPGVGAAGRRPLALQSARCTRREDDTRPRHQRHSAGHRHGPRGDPDGVHQSLWVAVPFLIPLGALGGYLVVPMNALLRHRGHMLMGAGPFDRGAIQSRRRSSRLWFYAGMTALGLSACHGDHAIRPAGRPA